MKSNIPVFSILYMKGNIILWGRGKQYGKAPSHPTF